MMAHTQDFNVAQGSRPETLNMYYVNQI